MEKQGCLSARALPGNDPEVVLANLLAVSTRVDPFQINHVIAWRENTGGNDESGLAGVLAPYRQTFYGLHFGPVALVFALPLHLELQPHRARMRR
jgi:hypothetical protein